MDALMGARIFEEAYNIVLHMGEQAYGRKGKPQSILDYRCTANCSSLPVANWPAHAKLMIHNQSAHSLPSICITIAWITS
jgi:hypothetical protein